MFGFLNSAVLMAAFAALIPLLIHLFSKRRVKVLEFSSLRHLKQMQKRQVRRIKIRQLLLLLLRMLIVLVAVLAFARPASEGGYIGSHAGVSAVILLDNSASMQRQVKDGVLADLAEKRVRDIMDDFGESDELLLIPFDREALFPAGKRFFSRDIAENILEGTPAGYDRGDIGTIIDEASRQLADAKNLNREMYIVSDRQLNNLPDSIGSSDESITTFLVDLPLETDGNCGIVDVDLGGQLIEIGSAFTVRADIRNYDHRAKTELLASLFVDGTRVMQGEYKIDGNGNETVQFTHAVTTSGRHFGRVALSDDGYAPDNNYYFSFHIPDRFSVLVVDGDGGGRLAGLALTPDDKITGYWTVKYVDPDKLASVRLDDYDVIMLSGVKSLGNAETSRLFRYVDEGGGLFLVLGGGNDAGYYNENFTSKTGLYINEPIPKRFTRAGYFQLERFDFTHPVYSVFDSLTADNAPVLKYYALPSLENRGGNRILASFSNGMPALAEASYGLGTIMTMTAPLTPAYSDISGHSFFVPMIIRISEYLAGDRSAFELRNFVGEKTIRSHPGRDVGYKPVRMITPDGRTFNIAGTEKGGQVEFECRPIDIPGIYRLEAEGKIIDLFAVNTPPAEGDLSSADTDRFKTALGLDKTGEIPYNASAGSIINEYRYGRELWKVFLWAVVVLIAVEMLLSRERTIRVDES
jgi:hypothetical protein